MRKAILHLKQADPVLAGQDARHHDRRLAGEHEAEEQRGLGEHEGRDHGEDDRPVEVEQGVSDVTHG